MSITALPFDDLTINALQATMVKALVKYGDTTPLGDVLTAHEKFAVLVREVGEVAEDLPPYGAKAQPENLVGELLQVAAMALSWVQSLDAPERKTVAAKCPYCGETFYALPLHDPLKHHIQYCDKRPEDDDDE